MKQLLLVFLFVSLNLSAKDDYLRFYCDLYAGEIVHSYKCPKSGLTIPFDFCVAQREGKPNIFFDGCTGPTGGHTKLFYKHCIEHDLCYHREPATNGKTQKDCDVELREDLLKSCEHAVNRRKCRSWANAMYRAVRMFGKLAYNCADIPEPK